MKKETNKYKNNTVIQQNSMKFVILYKKDNDIFGKMYIGSIV